MNTINLKDLMEISKPENLFEKLDKDNRLVEDTLDDATKIRLNGLPEQKFFYSEMSDDELDEVEKQMKYILENPSEVDKPGAIEIALDNAYKRSKTAQIMRNNDWLNVLLVGPAGIGKTAIINKWAKKRDVNLVHVLASNKDASDMGGAITPDKTGEIVKRLASVEWDALGEISDSVLFLDEFNRAKDEVRGTLLTLIQDHVVEDPRLRDQGGVRKLPNFLFTVAAINPSDGGYNTRELDIAEITRFQKIELDHDKQLTMNYLKSELSKKLNQLVTEVKDSPEFANAPEDIQEFMLNEMGTELKRKFQIVVAIEQDPEFQFDSKEEMMQVADRGDVGITTARSLTNLINACDGTKEDFINKWSQFCNPDKLDMARRAMTNYKPVRNKATSVFGKNSAKKAETNTEDDMFSKMIAGL